VLQEDERFMHLALRQAIAARAEGEVPVGAVVVLDGEVVGTGRNGSVALIDPTAHAEIRAIREASSKVGNYRLMGATLYCTVEPCLMCLGAAMHSRIRRIVYGAQDSKVRATLRLEEMRAAGASFNHRIETSGGILAEEAASLILDFFRERRPAAADEDPGEEKTEVGEG
jgi:tRNA(adenine34) deaminase